MLLPNSTDDLITAWTPSKPDYCILVGYLEEFCEC